MYLFNSHRISLDRISSQFFMHCLIILLTLRDRYRRGLPWQIRELSILAMVLVFDTRERAPISNVPVYVDTSARAE